jgi:hypothetical protein
MDFDECIVYFKGWIGSIVYGLEGFFNLPSAICIDMLGSRKVGLFGAVLQASFCRKFKINVKVMH